jgi:hypothetical protein
MASFVMRLAGLGARTVGNALVNIYDMAIFFPLKIEELFVSPKSGSSVELPEARRTASRA